MAKLTFDDWATIRANWEEDPKLSFGDIAKSAGVSKQAISLKAKKDGWCRRGELPSIAAAATRKADAASDPNGQADDLGPYRRLVAREEAEDKRAGVLVKHRDEIVVLDRLAGVSRGLFAAAVQSKDKDDWWRAKISADALREHVAAAKMKQDMERKAWGMDAAIDPSTLKNMSDEQLESIAQGKLPG